MNKKLTLLLGYLNNLTNIRWNKIPFVISGISTVLKPIKGGPRPLISSREGL